MLNNQLSQFAQSCSSGPGIDLSIPTWYRGLPCEDGVPQPGDLNGLWQIGANVIDILLFVAGVVAVFFFIYGGIKLAMSQGQPDKIAQARQMLIYAAVGLVVTIIGRVAVQYIVQTLLGGPEINTGVE